jgi:hypothetical protein
MFALIHVTCCWEGGGGVRYLLDGRYLEVCVKSCGELKRSVPRVCYLNLLIQAVPSNMHLHAVSCPPFKSGYQKLPVFF